MRRRCEGQPGRLYYVHEVDLLRSVMKGVVMRVGIRIRTNVQHRVEDSRSDKGPVVIVRRG